MRRIKLVLSVATVAVSMLAVSAAPALADDFDGTDFRDGQAYFLVDGFGFFDSDDSYVDDGAFDWEFDQEATSGNLTLSSNVS